MFEEKIKLTPIEIDNVVEKEIYGQKVKFNKYLPVEYYGFIIDNCMERFIEINNQEKNFTSSILSIMQTLNIYLCYFTTNIDIEDITYNDLCAMGIFSTIEKTLINYHEIKDMTITAINIMINYFIYNTLEQLPTANGMAENLSEIKDIFTSNPEKAKEFANIVISNHPELKSFGEIFEKFLNNLNKKE